jgi:pimeloyl-ACP methyl ester carboxylesterase
VIFTRPAGAMAWVALGLLAGSGSALRAQSPMVPAPLGAPPTGSAILSQPQPPVSPSLAQAQSAFAQGLAWEQANQPQCVDAFYETTVQCWQAMAASAQRAPNQPLPADAWSMYHDALARLIRTGQQHGRLDPRSGLRVNTSAGAGLVPVRFSEFAWRPEDFHQLLVVGDYRSERPQQIFRRPGLGVPLVVISPPEANVGFLRGEHPFSATVILRFDAPGPTPETPSASLDFYDSLIVQSVPFAGREIPMAGDTTAPLTLSISRLPPRRLIDRLQPGSNANPPELFFLEPYRPGRIPIVFVHGLLSDPATWADMANDLRSIPWVNQRYQLWAFRYPTLDPFLESAAAMRAQTHQAIAQLDPLGTQPALQHMVLVGHSMGGLVSRLQVCQGGPVIWNHFANRPIEALVADPASKSRLMQDFYFQPSPFVRRVVFIGTPHGGSTLASLCIGRLGSSLAKPSPERRQAHDMLLQYNPNTFSPELTRGFPNSIDLLEPDSILLTAMKQAPLNPQVRFHSVIGFGYRMLSGGDSDSIVPVSSARFAGVQTETFVHAKHTELHHKSETLQVLLQILGVHYAEYEAATGVVR